MTPEPAAVVVRPAVPEDAEPLTRCHLACWSETYTGLVPQQRLDEAVAAHDERAGRWRSILAGAPSTLLAEHGQEVLGFASAGPDPDGDLPDLIRLHALYVRRSRWGTGLGHRLLTAVLGDAPASLWVLETNTRASRFYSAHGFRPDGRREVNPGFDRWQIRMVRTGWADAPGGAGVGSTRTDGGGGTS